MTTRMPPIPATGLAMRSTVTADGAVEIGLTETAVPVPGPGQVLIAVRAAPINPSDLMTMLCGADIGAAITEPDSPTIRIPLSASAFATASARVGIPMPVGQEGAGRVVAAGDGATGLLGRNVAVISPTAGTFADHLLANATDCVALPDELDARKAAGAFINPLTASAIVETVRLDHPGSGLIHTAAASSLGRILVKLCLQEGIPLVNIVRRGEQADLLRTLGAEHVCDSSDPDFHAVLASAIGATNATVAFDAVGGGTIAGDLLVAMESVAAARLDPPSPYGSFTAKHVYIYGHLDPAPTLLRNLGNGLLWGVSGWMMPQILARLGDERLAALRQRIVDEIETTFAIDHGPEVSLTQALTVPVITAATRCATGAKHLIVPAQPDSPPHS